MEEEKIFAKRCVKCGRTFKSLYKKQLEYNFDLHDKSCEKKKK